MAKQGEKNEGKRGRVELRVTARLLGGEGREEIPQVHAYAFDRGGRLLDRGTVSEEGTATLKVPVGREARSIRVIVAGEEEAKEVRAAELLRRGGEERLVRLDPGRAPLDVQVLVPEQSWLCWFRGFCLVRGKLLKRTERDGIALDLPVCNADVEVFEVDPIWVILPRLPDLELERIRDFILRPRPLPEPPEPRPPLRDPPFGEPELSFRGGAGPVPASFALRRLAGPQPEPPTLEASIPRELAVAAATATSQRLRAELARFPFLVRPLLCLLAPTFVTKQRVGTAKTDDCGRFQTFIQLGCNNPDTPDLYFRATQRLFGFLTIPIYAPTPVSCHTWWNYQCGSEVVLYTRHPLAQACPPCPAIDAPPKWVLALAVGNTRLDRIHGTSPALQASTDAANRGLLDGATGPDRPFGGLCRLRLEFDSEDLRAAGVKYYRVSWRKGTSGAFAPLFGSVVRHYHKEVGDDLVLQVYPLGPNSVPVQGSNPPQEEANLFEIPPVLPPEGNWSHPDVVEDTTSAKFPTHTLPPFGDPSLTEEQELLVQAGKYQLKVELFHESGQPVSLAAQGITFRVPDGEDANGTVFTADAATLGLVTGDSFIMPLHVDNNRCSAEVHAPVVGTLSADDSCGVLLYDPYAAPPQQVTMGFSAAHPNGFASYSFVVNRGIPNVVNESGSVPAGSVTRAIDGALLGPCAAVTGGVAAFAEHLYVDALATNGWSTLNQYDASDLRAFVLTPEPEAGGGGGGS
jgi:hypothetical protein